MPIILGKINLPLSILFSKIQYEISNYQVIPYRKTYRKKVYELAKKNYDKKEFLSHVYNFLQK